jgi:hypothetical protein
MAPRQRIPKTPPLRNPSAVVANLTAGVMGADPHYYAAQQAEADEYAAMNELIDDLHRVVEDIEKHLRAAHMTLSAVAPGAHCGGCVARQRGNGAPP